MSILEKDRKLLWGRSANRCSICKTELVILKTENDDDSIIGEECHIVSKKENGPRFRNNFELAKADNYSNLVLLCRIHHKIIDDQVNEYSEETLLKIKEQHEKWICEKLNEKKIEPIRFKMKSEDKVDFLFRITSGQVLANMLMGVHQSSFNHDELINEGEVELIGTFLQEIQDYADIYDDLEQLSKTRSEFLFSEYIKKIEEAGFWVFGNVEKRIIEGGYGAPSIWNVVFINVIRNNNSDIIALDLHKKNND